MREKPSRQQLSPKALLAHYHHRSSFIWRTEAFASRPPGLLLSARLGARSSQLLAFHTYQNSLTSLVKLLLVFLFSPPPLPAKSPLLAAARPLARRA
jgi:hypothetical protein